MRLPSFLKIFPVALLLALAAVPLRAQTIPGITPPDCPPNASCAPGTPTPPTPPGTCGPGNGGATCGGAGPASVGSATGVNVGAGNPINIINGNKYQREVDMAPLPGTLGLEIVRHYNSAFSRPNASTNLVGRGWKLSYETELYTSGHTVQIVQADGARIIFSRDPRDPSLCASGNPANGTVSISKTARGDEYVWRWTNGRSLSFDSKGKLVQILAPGGQFVSLQHDGAGLLVKVTDPQGRSLNLSYLDKAQARAGDAFRGVQAISSPVGRFTYHHGSPMPKGAQIDKRLLLANLVKVDMPTGSRYYHYEDARFPTLLTGISELATDARKHPAWQRMSTYGYAEDGRARLSIRSLPGTQGKMVRAEVRLDFSIGGQTTVTNEQGLPTVFRHAVIAGEYRLLEVRGPGCADCGPSNVRYRYDELGRLVETIRLDTAGVPQAGMRTEFDGRGRPLLTSKIAYVNGRPGALQWQNRFEYSGDATQPTRVFRPSVVAGKEAVVTMAYAAAGAAAGMPLSVREDGFLPSISAYVPAAVISRTITYRYNAYGERVEADGPLPNASANASPANSDLTLTEFDPATKLPLRIRHPGNRIEEVLERDAALRPRIVRISDGPVVRTITMTLNWRGQPEQVEVSGAAPVRYRYDVNGQPINNGAAEALSRMAPAAFPADPTGRDWLSRPVAWRGTDGSPVALADWGVSGTAAQASVLAISTGTARAERMIDDFGRVAAIRNPGQGWQLAQHDAAGRIVESIDARGARQHAEWDAAGRLLKLVRYAAGTGTPEQTVTYRYAGPLAVEQQLSDADGTRLTRSEYDAQGRILRQSLIITPSSRMSAALAGPVTMRQDWRYDARGRLTAHTFTDNTGASFELAQDSDAQGLPSRMVVRGALPEALGGGRAIVAGIAWTQLPTGPFAQRIVHGDGSVDQFNVVPGSAPASGPRYQQVGFEPGADTPLRRAPGRGVDGAGLPAAITTAKADQHLEWDAAGQLARSVRADGSTRYLYDANRQRVARIVTDAADRATATLFFYHDKHLIAEADARGRMQYAYTYLGWRPLAQLDLRPQSWWGELKRKLFGAPVRHLHTDRAGRVTGMTQDGRKLWSDATATEPQLLRVAGVSFGAVHQPLRYVSQYQDEDSGLTYHGARYFDPGSGRFLSPDPAGIDDALSGVPAPLLLDLYAYAGGRPDEFFDPDGAARIRYFAITTGASGQALGMSQGFTKARWAFVVDNVKAGIGNSKLVGKQNEYAQTGTGLLVDIGGNFLKDKQTSITWSGGGGMDDVFAKHYSNNLISIPEFTLEMSDADATTLIASYIAADRQALFGNSCPARAALLPQIGFAPEEVPIKVTSATLPAPGQSGKVLAQSQRIVECGNASANDPVARRLDKYNYAAMLLESSPPQITKDCSSDGCPGRNLIKTVLPNYIASYGQTQFIGTTMVDTLRRLKNRQLPIDAPGRTALRLDDAALWADVDAAAKHAAYVAREFNRRKAGAPDWDAAPQADRNAFTAGTGLDAGTAKTIWNDINRWKRSPTPDFNGEARAAFATTVLMAKPNVRDYLMGIFRDSAHGGRFYQVSMALMRKSYNDVQGQVNQTNRFAQKLPNGQPNPEWAAHQRQIEIELAMRTGRAHNGDYNKAAQTGTFDAVLAADSAKAGRQYGHRLVNAYEYPVVQPPDPKRRQPTADYFAMRCTADLPSNVPRGGIQVNALNLQ